MARFNTVVAFVIRNRVKIAELLLLAAAVVVVAFLAFEFEVFATEENVTREEETIELAEVMMIAAVLCVGLLIFAARRLIEQRRELTRRIAAEERARTLAFHDPLTGLPNRRLLNEQLAAAIATPPRPGGAHALIVVDLNGFKRVNDVFGHGVGDEVLIAVSTRFQAALRDDDLVARLGGDEFAILARHLSGPEEATNVALRLVRSLDAPIVTGASQHSIGTGVGIALIPQDGCDPADLMRKADIALYRAKDEPVSAMRFFEPEMDAKLRQREELERELRAAVRDNAIEMAYQPLCDLKTGAIVAFEALARWTNDRLGELEPERFIPVAVDTGLIQQLTEQLLRKACAAALEWPDAIALSFNISPTQLRDDTLGLRVLNILAETGLAPNRLELEITESAIVRDLDAAQRVLGALRAAGVQIALDDFGTGYSSLYHLRTFRVDKIKIDRSFIETMKSQPESAELVRAILGLGKGLGLEITAEGIENQTQLDFLKDRGCEQGQGFLFSQAVPAAEAASLVRGHTAALAGALA